MTVIINGTTGVTSVNGSAAAPSVTGTDTDTGIVYGTNTITLSTNGTAGLVQDASQNVGVGTSSPAYKLDVVQSNPTRGIVGQIQNSAASGQTGAQLEFLQNGVDYWSIGQPAGASAFSFWSGRYSGADGTEIMRITNTGNLGVGTTSPSSRLHVNGGSAYDGNFYINGQFLNTSGSSEKGVLTGYNNADTSSILGAGYAGGSGALAFWTHNGSAWGERARIDSSGNFLLGTTTNTYSSILNVLGNSQVTGRRRGYVFANGTSAGTTGTYTVSVTGYTGYNSGGVNEVSSYFFVTFLSTGLSHEVHGVALYGNIYNGNAILLATLGTGIVAGGGITFGASGASPTITITNSSGSTPNYYCQVCYIN